MGFFDSLWNLTKCATGFHDWSDWSSSQCIETRSCKRCDAKETVANHTWSKWQYKEDGDCMQLRRCSACHKREQRTFHHWGVWEREDPTSDALVRFCRRCPHGRDEKEPNVILRVPTTDLAYPMLVSLKMKQFAPNNKDNNSLGIWAESIISSYKREGGGVEIGYRPQPTRRGFRYLSWEWDETTREYKVVEWHNDHWVG